MNDNQTAALIHLRDAAARVARAEARLTAALDTPERQAEEWAYRELQDCRRIAARYEVPREAMDEAEAEGVAKVSA